jgi:hypothetical protein
VVGPGPAVEHVAALAAVEAVVARAAGQPVGARAAGQPVGARAAAQALDVGADGVALAGRAAGLRAVGDERDRRRALGVVDVVAARAAHEPVGAAPAAEPVVAVPALEGLVRGTAGEPVVAALAGGADRPAQPRSLEHQRVVAVAEEDRQALARRAQELHAEVLAPEQRDRAQVEAVGEADATVRREADRHRVLLAVVRGERVAGGVERDRAGVGDAGEGEQDHEREQAGAQHHPPLHRQSAGPDSAPKAQTAPGTSPAGATARPAAP